MKITGIYYIKNKVNNKIYIGATRNFEKRKKQHLYALQAQRHHNKNLQVDWDFYKADNFDFVFLQQCDEYELLELEKMLIEANISICYNKYRRWKVNTSIKKEEKLSKRNVGQRWVRKNVKGYYWEKSIKKYRAQIRINGIKTNLGDYDTPEEAGAAYQEAKRIYH